MIVKDMGLVEYQPTYEAMQIFTASRDKYTDDELWLLEHTAVFTQGLNSNNDHILAIGDIPVIKTDRGGQITYHGPGQLVAYTLFDLRRHNIGVRQMVSCLENIIMSLLTQLGINAQRRLGAPGVYVGKCKIAALGLRVKQGACYHGISLNVAMDLTPFSLINPCGYQGMDVTDLMSIGCDITMEQIKQQFISVFKIEMKQAST